MANWGYLILGCKISDLIACGLFNRGKIIMAVMLAWNQNYSRADTMQHSIHSSVVIYNIESMSQQSQTWEVFRHHHTARTLYNPTLLQLCNINQKRQCRCMHHQHVTTTHWKAGKRQLTTAKSGHCISTQFCAAQLITTQLQHYHRQQYREPAILMNTPCCESQYM